MKLTPEQLASWFYTAFPAPFPPEAESEWLHQLSNAKGRERSAMISGMKQGMNDALNMLKMMPEETRAEVNLALADKELPTIEKMEVILKKKHQRILKRGHIKNDEEFYIVAEILSDLEFDISPADRRRLGEIYGEYEERKK